MHHVRQENLPFVGSSHQFVGAEQGDTRISVFLFHGKPGSGPGPHRHLMTRSSSSVRAAEYARSTARRLRVARELSRSARSTVSRRLAIRR
jgi:hypothetical protein